MWLRVVTSDDRLFVLVQQVIAELSTNDWHLSAGEYVPDAKIDLYLLDYTPGDPLPEPFLNGHTIAERYKYFLLIDKKELQSLREQFPRTDFGIILKPATHASLGALLGQALEYHQSRNSPSAGTLRADRDELLQSLMQANLRLQEYDQDRTHFLARAAHDFRSPLTAITGYCGLLLEEALGPLQESQRDVLQRIQHSSKRLSRLASGMFQLSINGRIDSRPVLEKADLRRCIDDALLEVGQFTGEKQISINLQYTSPAATLYFDQDQVEHVLINLLDNACKFTPKFGSIQIHAYPYFWERRVTRWEQRRAERRLSDLNTPNSHRIDITDSGPPILAEHAARLFEEHTSYGGAHDRSGGGLSLAICKMILGRHHGAIWAEPDAHGGWFSFVLPFQAPAVHGTAENGQSAASWAQF